MSPAKNFVTAIEPERYELREPKVLFATSRRDFFKFLGTGIVIGCAAAKTAAAQESGGGRRRNSEDDLPRELDAWLHIDPNGGITAFTGKVEVGQNIRTSLSQAVAEELCVPLNSIRLVMGDTDQVPFDMGTFGSRTTPQMNLQLRRVSAAARDALVGIAAKQWNVDAAKLTAENGRVFDAASKRSATYNELVRGRQITQLLPNEDPLIPAAQWKVAGRTVAKIDGRDFVTGKHRYPADQKLPGMLYGKIVRPNAFNAKLISADTREAEKMLGVTVVRDGDFIGVAAPSSALATKAAKAIKAEWKSDPQPSTAELFTYLKKNTSPKEKGSNSEHAVGDVEKALASSNLRITSTYNVNYIAHAPLEPRAAVAQWNGDQLTVWTGTQRPFGVRSELATAFHIPEEKIRVQMPDTGSGYGGKHTGEAAIEAARLARAAKRPVKIVWSREEEFTWAYFRPAGVIEVSSAVAPDGKITAWDFRNYNSGSAGIRTYYEIPNQRIEFVPVDSPLRQGSYRGLASTANHFAREVHMDELAALVKMDPLEFRLKNIKDERLRAVFAQAAEKFGWKDQKPSAGIGYGMGGGYEKLGYVATFAEVHVDASTGNISVNRIVTAFECGAVVNPDGLRNQVEGANIMGIGGALFEAIQFENGRILNPHFAQYRVPRFKDIPQLETILIDRKDLPSVGAGECPIVGIAPAIANAIHQATGQRLRTLPLAPNGLKSDTKSV
jgi:nicotinate dehydrogenase subunit B